jgi:DNA-binding ferritin-like protein (Dps family)
MKREIKRVKNRIDSLDKKEKKLKSVIKSISNSLFNFSQNIKKDN